VRSAVFVPAVATREVLDWDDAIGAMRAAYAAPHAPRTSQRAQANGTGNWLRGMVSIPPGGATMGAKVFGVARARRASYLIALFDQESGELTALVDGIHVTALRTAATSAVALDCMAPRRALSLAVLGSGQEAQAHVRAFAHVRELKQVRLYSTSAVNRESATGLLAADGIRCSPEANARAAMEGADVVLAAARAHGETPVFDGEWLRPGMLVVSIGSTSPAQREIDPRTIERSELIVCDAVDEVAEQTGDFIAARAAGVAFEEKMASLNDLVLGKAHARLAGARLSMYKSVGEAVQDVTVAELAVRRARERGLAIGLPVALEAKQV
jgi:ornithine cyclodeaminase/alanine dehydrogenase